MNYSKTCDHCGHTLTAFTIHMNAGLASAFVAFSIFRISAGRPVKKRDLNLDHSQYGNFQKLRHFGLIEKRELGAWEMTPTGWAWLTGKTLVLNPAAQFGNTTLPENHPAWLTHAEPRTPIKLADSLPAEWKERASYIAEKAGAA